MIRKLAKAGTVLGGMLGLAALGIAVGQSPELIYQSRGKYSEGILPPQRTGAALDLVAALIDYTDAQETPGAAVPTSYAAAFYLPASGEPFLTIREVQPRYNYWLSELSTRQWQTGKTNDFVWPTDVVVRFLNYKGGPLTLSDLGAIVRVGKKIPSQDEVVAPAALYRSARPRTAKGYRFSFLPSQQMRLTFEMYSESRKQVVDKQTATISAKVPYPSIWEAAHWPDGWYRLLITGYAVSDNSKVRPLVVHFYHSARLE
jgi:hypothetical protein